MPKGVYKRTEFHKQITLNNFSNCINQRRLGSHQSEETKLKISIAKKGKPSNRKGAKQSDATKKKLRDYFLGKPSPRKGKPLPEKHRMKLPRGKNHHWWSGGKQLYSNYPDDFNYILKRKIKARDSNVCRECGFSDRRLDVHHIDFDKNNSDESNLITLCCSCHAKTRYNRNQWIVYYKIKMKEESFYDGNDAERHTNTNTGIISGGNSQFME